MTTHPTPSIERQPVHRVRSVRLASAARCALAFFAAAAVVGLIAGVVLYAFARVTGSLPTVEREVRLFVPGMRLTPGHLLPIALVAAAIEIAVGTALTIAAAALYNIVADLGYGLELATGEPIEASAVSPVDEPVTVGVPTFEPAYRLTD
jgi:transketolase N-terminal domain/subunit